MLDDFISGLKMQVSVWDAQRDEQFHTEETVVRQPNPRSILTSVAIRTCDVKINTDDITLYYYGRLSRVDIGILHSLKENKPLDVYIWQCTSVRLRPFLFDFRKSEQIPTEAEKKQAKDSMLTSLTVIYITYLLRGSLRNLFLSQKMLLLFLLLFCGGIRVELRDIAPSQLCSPGYDASRIKLPMLLRDFFSFAPTLPRVVQHYSPWGTLIFNVMNCMTDKIQAYSGLSPEWKKLFSRPVLMRAPYISFHPHQKMNPLCDATIHFMLSLLVRIWANDGDTLDDLFNAHQKRFKPPLHAAMKAAAEPEGGRMPSYETFKCAVEARYSIKVVTQATTVGAGPSS